MVAARLIYGALGVRLALLNNSLRQIGLGEVGCWKFVGLYSEFQRNQTAFMRRVGFFHWEGWGRRLSSKQGASGGLWHLVFFRSLRLHAGAQG